MVLFDFILTLVIQPPEIRLYGDSTADEAGVDTRLQIIKQIRNAENIFFIYFSLLCIKNQN